MAHRSLQVHVYCITLKFSINLSVSHLLCIWVEYRELIELLALNFSRMPSAVLGGLDAVAVVGGSLLLLAGM